MERGRLRKALCSEVSRENAEPLGATASRVEHWILVEYRGVWGHDALSGSGLSVDVKEHLRERAKALRPAKTLFIRRPEGSGGDGLSVFWGSSPERGGRLFRAELGGYEDLLDLDFGAGGEPVDHPLLLVCTHGKHDRCCARYGRPLLAALRDQAEPGWLWQCSHVGGDRFAGNLVCLPEGLWFGRVGRDDAWLLLDEYLAGRIHLELYRGRSCYPFAVQAAERAVRAETGLTGIGDLELVTREPIRFRAGGRVLEVEVEEETGELTYLTCSAPSLSHVRRYAAKILPGSAG
jgi:hypothetical protein